VDTLGGRLSLTFSFGGAGVVMILFYFTGLISSLTVSFSAICIVTFIGGCLQAFGWPSTIKALSEAIEAQTRNGLIPLWTTCCYLGSSIGGIAIAYIMSFIQVPDDIKNQIIEIVDFADNDKTCNFTNELYSSLEEPKKVIDWRLTFLLPGLLPVALSVLIFLTLPKPQIIPEKKASAPLQEKPEEKLSMLQIIQEVPGCINLAASYACAKGARYWFFYWAPIWLTGSLSKIGISAAQAGFMSTALDIGGVIALVIIGPVTSKNRLIKKPIPPMYASLASCLLSIPFIWLAYYFTENATVESSTKTKVYLSIVLFIIGALVNIPDPILSGVSASDASDLHGGGYHAGVSGFINGVGSAGAAVVLPITSWLADRGWIFALVFVMLLQVGCSIMTFLAHRRIEKARMRLPVVDSVY